MGAGSVGCYLGGLLAAAGLRVVFVGRPRVLQALRAQGLTLTDRDGLQQSLMPDALVCGEEIPAGLAPAVTLLCVKSGATAEAAARLGAALPADSIVLSMQNGIGNADAGRVLAPQLQWRAGMVPFNIAELAPGHYHRGTAGDLVVQGSTEDARLATLQAAFSDQGLGLKLLPDLGAVQWGKLLINLNNPVNALSGQPLRAELLQRDYRRCFAALQAEALDLLEAAKIPVAQMAPVPPRVLIRLLRLPTPLFRLIAARMLKIDAKARSSMADDLALGRLTEIDALCGEVVRLAQRLGRQAPINARMLDLVQAWPQQRKTYSPKALLAALASTAQPQRGRSSG